VVEELAVADCLLTLCAPRIPSDEAERLEALRSLGILDSAPSESFDRITRLAARALRVPIASVTLIDAKRAWVKSTVGFGATEVPRRAAFCAHAILERTPMVVRDALQDPRFAGNPFVTGEPHIRSYIGVATLTVDGQPIGTFCAVDYRPRDFTADEIDTVCGFGRMVEEIYHARELEIRSAQLLQIATANVRLFRDTFEQAAVGIFHSDPATRLLRLNRRACEILGYAEGELASTSLMDITHPDDLAVNTDQFRRMLKGEFDDYRLEKRLRHKDGHYVWVLLSETLIRVEPAYIISAIEDISASKRTEAEITGARDSLRRQVAIKTKRLRRANRDLRMRIAQVVESECAQRHAERFLRTTTNSIPAQVGYWNKNLVCEFANGAYREWFGLEPDQVVGLRLIELLGEEVFREDEPRIRATLGGEPQHFQRLVIKAGGSRSYADVRLLPDADESGDVSGFFVMVNDVTELREIQLALEEANLKLKQDSVTDYLTGVYNRRHFSVCSEQAARRFRDTGEAYGLMLLDLDDFKRVNDTYGHDVGDEVLATVGQVLSLTLRDTRDIAARLGGEEFGVLCFDAPDERSIRALGERIRMAIEKSSIWNGTDKIGVTCCVGVALSRAGDPDWKTIYSRADDALYEAKSNGKNRLSAGVGC
jgi:diguanylate cyclase (GGDEF)-like protein/PAS domain S-box-containing protein